MMGVGMNARVLRTLLSSILLWWLAAGKTIAAPPFIMHDKLVQHQLKLQNIDLDLLWNETVLAAFNSDEEDLLREEIITTGAIARPRQREKLQAGLQKLSTIIANAHPYVDPELGKNLLAYFSWDAISARIALGDPHVLSRPNTPIVGNSSDAIVKYANFASCNQDDPSFSPFWEHRAPAPPPPEQSFATRMASYFVCYLVLSSTILIPACRFFM
jgi:hypothetical protein